MEGCRKRHIELLRTGVKQTRQIFSVLDAVMFELISNLKAGIAKDTTLKWRIMNINADGTVDIVSTAPIATKIYFKNAVGYNNGVYLLNDLCKTHYSNTTLGVTARSLDLEDIEKKLNSTGIDARDTCRSAIGTYGTTGTYTSSRKAPDIYTKVNKDTAGESEDYYTSPTTATYTTPSSLTAKQTYYYLGSTQASFDDSAFRELIFGTGTDFWLATRYTDCQSIYVNFGLRYVIGSVMHEKNLFDSNGNSGDHGAFVRPVVTLTSNIQISASGGTESNPRTLEKK